MFLSDNQLKKLRAFFILVIKTIDFYACAKNKDKNKKNSLKSEI